MTYSTPKTYSASTKVSVSDRNVYERDNVTWLHDADAAATRLTSGLGSGTSVGEQTWTRVPLNSSDYANPAGMFDEQEPTRLTIVEDGVYVASGSVLFADVVATGNHAVAIRKNGGEWLGRNQSYKPNKTNGPGVTVTVVAALSAGDYLELWAWQDTGSGRDLTPEVEPVLAVARIRDDSPTAHTTSWPGTKTYTSTEVLNAAADLNTYERDAIEYLHDVPACHASQLVGLGSEQSITEGTWTVLNLNQEEYDTGSMHSTVTNNSRITVPETAVYFIEGKMEWFPTATSHTLRAALRVNGTTFIAYQSGATNTSNSVPSPMCVSRIDQLTANDYVELVVLHYDVSGTAALSVHGTGGEAPSLSVTRLRDS